MDVISAKSILSRAEGTAVAPVDGLPAVTLASDGKPSVMLPAATKPAALVAQDLITGAGPVVQSGQTITVHYTGWTWDGNAFDSSWDKGSTFSTTIGSGEVIKGWETGLIGKAGCSQVEKPIIVTWTTIQHISARPASRATISPHGWFA